MSSSSSIVANRLKGKVAIVTGAGTGMGAATAIRFAAEGAAVVLVARRLDRLNQVEQQIHDHTAGAQTLVISADVSLEASNKHIVEETLHRFGRLDIAFNNAGIGEGARSFAETDAEQHSQIFRTNVDSVFYALKYQLPAMTSGGSIINNSSLAGLRAVKNISPSYIASKFAVNGFTQAAAIEGAPNKVRVNAVAPGVVLTEFMGSEESQQEMMKQFAKGMTLTNRIGASEEVAAVVAFLASDEASFITGSIYSVDGGGLLV